MDNLGSTLTPPVEWFLDRADLDLLGIGYVRDQQCPVTTHVTGRVCVSVQGLQECTRFNEMASVPDRWEITGNYATLRVRSRTYANVVSVDRTTVIPSVSNLFDGSGPDTEPATINYWVAEGVEMIKGIGQYQFRGKPLLIELKTTTVRH